MKQSEKERDVVQPDKRPVKATLKDVARAAGLGLGTVSRAMSGQGKVAPATRTRVLAAAAELGYVKNAAARALAGQRLRQVGREQLVLCHLRSNSYRDATFKRVCEAEGLRALCVSDREFANPAAAARELYARGVDGILLNPRNLEWSSEALRTFAEGPYSVVVLGREPGLEGFDLVRHSAFDYLRTALIQVAEMGFRRIQLILHRSISPLDDEGRLGAALVFQRRAEKEGIELRIDAPDLPLDAFPLERLREYFASDWAEVVLFDHFAFVNRMLDAGDLAELANKPYAAAMTADEADAYYAGVSGSPVDTERMYARGCQVLFDKIRLGSKGASGPPNEYVIEPRWETRASLQRG